MIKLPKAIFREFGEVVFEQIRTALQNGFKKQCRMAEKGLAAAVTNFGCSEQRIEAVCQ